MPKRTAAFEEEEKRQAAMWNQEVDEMPDENSDPNHRFIDANHEPITPEEVVQRLRDIGQINVRVNDEVHHDTSDSSSDDVGAMALRKETNICQKCGRNDCNPRLTNSPADLPYRGRCGERNMGKNELNEHWKAEIEMKISSIGKEVKEGLKETQEALIEHFAKLSERVGRIHSSSMSRSEWHATREDALRDRIRQLQAGLEQTNERGDTIVVANKRMEAHLEILRGRVNSIAKVQLAEAAAISQTREVVNGFCDQALNEMKEVQTQLTDYLEESRTMAILASETERFLDRADDADDEQEDSDNDTIAEQEPKRKMMKRKNPRVNK